ncbi:MAG: SDR family NAD(P)-dependent oxidoreductase [Lachnospiraceae bacterium]|nr:SDR family NAD(P)-dependent oxidoreductase [Lachnospiraceae bacterium]
MRKTALITGASRGIGLAIARKMAELGYDLFLTCEKNIDMLNSSAKELESTYGICVKTFATDMGNPGRVEELFSNITDLDVLVNNAGISYVGLLSEMSYEDWNRVISVNLSSIFYTCKNAVPMMLKKQAGRIINISSIWGKKGASMEVAYSASKGGINTFTKALAKELAPSNIAVNAIACGFVDTDMNAHLDNSEREMCRNEIPADRFASPKEIAEAVSALLTAPTYMTGQIIGVDGGWE